jgi:hypothetical protein
MEPKDVIFQSNCSRILGTVACRNSAEGFEWDGTFQAWSKPRSLEREEGARAGGVGAAHSCVGGVPSPSRRLARQRSSFPSRALSLSGRELQQQLGVGVGVAACFYWTTGDGRRERKGLCPSILPLDPGRWDLDRGRLGWLGSA